MDVNQELQEFIVICTEDTPNSDVVVVENRSDFDIDTLDDEHSELCKWNNETTRTLMHLYKLYRPKVGTSKLRNIKKLWELLAHLLRKNDNVNVTAQQVENRWRVLDRNYKKVIDNNNKTGRGRKIFEFQKEMDDIFQKKKNVHPEILLSQDTIVKPPNNHNEMLKPSANVSMCEKPEEKSFQSQPSQAVEASVLGRRQKKKITSNEILEKIRVEKSKYYESQIKLSKERNEIETQKLTEMRRRNELLERRWKRDGDEN